MAKQSRTPILPIIIVLVLLIGIPAVILAINLGFNPFAKAGPTETPKEIVIGNQTATSATVSFLTPAAATDATLKYGTSTDSLDLIASDNRDIGTGTSGNYTTHIIDLKNLQANTEYYFSPIIGGVEYDNGGSPFTFRTLPSVDTVATPQPNFGRIEPREEGALVYTHAFHDGRFSTAAIASTAQNGTFTFDLGTLRDTETGSAFDLTDARILSFASTGEGAKGGVIYSSDSSPGTITIAPGYAATYSPTMTSLPEVETPSGTPTITTRPTTSPAVTTVPTTTPSPTPTTSQQTSIHEQILFSTYSSSQEKTDSTIPYEIFVSNISANSFTVNWRTNEPTTGVVRVEQGSETATYLDIRDSSLQTRKERYTHSVSIDTSTLNTGTVTNFDLISNDTMFSPPGTEEFSFTIPDLTSAPPAPESKELTVDTTFASQNDRDQIVYGRKVSSDGNSTWKSDATGGANISLALGDSYGDSLDSFFSASTYTVELAAVGEFNSSDSTTSDLNSISELTLEPGTSLNSIRQGQELGGITTISGTADPNSSVSVSINGSANQATADSNGGWLVSAPIGLLAGDNQINVKANGTQMGTGFSITLTNLPATDIDDFGGLAIGVLFVVIGLILKRYIARAVLKSN
ncbi:MAG: fibronectin type III domain-containing protein [Candidatus Dojkabacteria bacterium]